MVHVNDGGKREYLKGAMWNPPERSVQAEIAKSTKKAPNCIWDEKEFPGATGGTHKLYSEKNSEGRVIRELWDYYADDFIDEVETYEYDKAGNVTKYTLDRNADGMPDKVATHEYDKAGNKTKSTYDDNADGKPEEVVNWEYDEAGRLTKCTIDDNADGKPDIVTTRKYNEAGEITNEHSEHYE